MKLNEYQDKAKSTAHFPSFGADWVYLALGITGEAGEVADKLKKVIRDDNGVASNSVKKMIATELGDVLWYISMLADSFGYTLQDIAQMNIDKLADRERRGVIGGSGDNR